MLTIFTIPKPFKDHIAIIQRNALESWLRLRPVCEIILFGNDYGVAEAAAEFGVRHVPEISTTEYNTPFVSVAFEKAQQLAQHPLVCYVNADIILLDDLLTSVKRIPFERYMMVGQRWDVDITVPLDTKSDLYDATIQKFIRQGKRHPPTGSDYFIHPRGMIQEMPPFAVGRPAWDNWLIQHVRSLGLPVIDASQTVTVVHQNHDYSHVPQGDYSKSWDSPEASWNYALMGSQTTLYTLKDATYRLTRIGLIPERIFNLPTKIEERLRLLRQRARWILRLPFRAMRRLLYLTRCLYRHFWPRKQDTN